MIARDHQRRDDRLRRAVIARSEIGLRDAHQRSFDDVAERIVGGIFVRAVDEIVIISLLYDKSSVGGHLT